MARRGLKAQEVIDQVDLVQLISERVALEQRASGNFKGLCPFHTEEVPSFTVYPRSQSFYCFGCRAVGDAIHWLELLEGATYRQAIKRLRKRTRLGYDRPQPPPKKKVRAKKGEIPIKLIEHWHERLGERRVYFHQRGFADETINRELWGWSGYRYVLVVWEDEPQFSRVVQVRLRRADDLNPELLKYINLTGFGSPRLYNRWRLKEAKRAFIFWGEFDAALATQHGLVGISPTTGIAAWQEEWNDEFRGVEEIWLVPDKGEREQGYRAQSQLGLHTNVYTWPEFDGKDFSDFILAGHTIEEFLKGGGMQ